MLGVGHRVPAHPGRDLRRPAGHRVAHRQPQRPGLGARAARRAGAGRAGAGRHRARPARSACSSSATTPPRASASGSSGRGRALLLVAVGPGRASPPRRPGPIGVRRLRRPADRPPARRRALARRSCPSAACGALLLVRVRPRRPPAVRAHRAARRRRHRHPRRPLPPVAARPGQPDRLRRLTVDPMTDRTAPPPPSRAERPVASPTTTAWSSTTCRSRIPPGQITVIVGANACGKSTLLRGLARLLKPTRRHACCSTARTSTACPTKEVATRLGILPAAADRARGHHRRRPRRPRPLPAPALVPPVVARRRGGRRRGPGGHRDRRPRRPPRRRALGRPAPAGVDRHGPRPGHRR